MKILTDQDIYHITIKWLKKRDYDVVTAKEIGMSRATDRELLKKAKELKRILITRDKDFGTLTFLEKKTSYGIILLRMSPTNIEKIHKELIIVLNKYSKEQLKNLFVVVEPNRHRIRNLS